METGVGRCQDSIGFLLAGNYEVAYTCTGTDFVPVAGKEAVITIGADTLLDFIAQDAPASP